MIGVINTSLYAWRFRIKKGNSHGSEPIIGEQITTEGGTSVTTESGAGITTEEPV